MPTVAFLLLALLGLLIWVLYQRRQIQRYKEENLHIQTEKEAAISLMESVGEQMTHRIGLGETLETIAQYVVEATRAESGAIYLLDERDQMLEVQVVVGLFPPLFDDEEIASTKHQDLSEQIRTHKVEAGKGLIGQVALQDAPLLITDAEADPRVPTSSAQTFEIHTLILCPLKTRGRNLGVLVVVNKRGEGVFDSRDTFLLQALADQAAIAVDLVKLYDLLGKQHRLEQELEIANEFQRMLLPHECPRIENYEFAALTEAALVVGGDFYDFFPIGQDRLGIVIGDVSGKGIPAALIMAMVRSVIRAEAHDTLSPKDTLRRVNERVLADTKESVFVTVTFGVLDIPNQRFRFVRAGHEPTLLRREDIHAEIGVMRPQGMAVGLVQSETFGMIREAEIQLEPGDTVLLYTDGAVDAVNASSEEYGRKRLIDFLAGQQSQSPTELIDSLVEDVHEFSRGIPQHDDITLVAFRVKPKSAGRRGAEGRESQEETPSRAAQTA